MYQNVSHRRTYFSSHCQPANTHLEWRHKYAWVCPIRRSTTEFSWKLVVTFHLRNERSQENTDICKFCAKTCLQASFGYMQVWPQNLLLSEFKIQWISLIFKRLGAHKWLEVNRTWSYPIDRLTSNMCVSQAGNWSYPACDRVTSNLIFFAKNWPYFL